MIKAKQANPHLSNKSQKKYRLRKRFFYLALEYNERMAQGRFHRFTEMHQVHIVIESQIERMWKDGEDQFDDLIFQWNPELVVVNILAKLKRHNTGQYDAEYQAMREIKELIDKYDKDCLVLTHSRKPTPHDSEDPVDNIFGYTALQVVPDNLMMLTQSGKQTKLFSKGRLICPSEKLFSFSDVKYSEEKGVGVDLENKAQVQAQVLRSLEECPKTSKQLVCELGKDKGHISHVCSSLS